MPNGPSWPLSAAPATFPSPVMPSAQKLETSGSRDCSPPLMAVLSSAKARRGGPMTPPARKTGGQDGPRQRRPGIASRAGRKAVTEPPVTTPAGYSPHRSEPDIGTGLPSPSPSPPWAPAPAPASAVRHQPTRSAGIVYLVGAGPGDPGLITVRGADVLRTADVVVHDRLTASSLLSWAPPAAEKVDVGKQPDDRGDQAAINALLIERAKAGLRVVRLKGGDPFVFGRGGEEALALIEAAVAFEVIPGVTSAVAAPAYAGVPVTHRGLVTAFTVVAGHTRSVDLSPGRGGTDWEALARGGGTIVVLMGVAHRGRIAERLMAGGLSPATPVVAVQWGTSRSQVTRRTTLDQLGATPLAPPVTIVVGEVAGLDLAWFDNRPLFGRTVVVTRAAHQAAALSRRLEDLGRARPGDPGHRLGPAGRRWRRPGGQCVTVDRWSVFVGRVHLRQRGAPVLRVHP